MAPAVLGALGVVGFARPSRAVACFLVTLLFVAAALLAVERPALAGLVLWLLGSGAGMLVLITTMLLGVTSEEAGARRFRVTGVLVLFLLAYVGAVVAGLITGRAPPTGERAPGGAEALARGLFEEHGAALAFAFVALAASVLAALLMVRRRG